MWYNKVKFAGHVFICLRTSSQGFCINECNLTNLQPFRKPDHRFLLKATLGHFKNPLESVCAPKIFKIQINQFQTTQSRWKTFSKKGALELISNHMETMFPSWNYIFEFEGFFNLVLSSLFLSVHNTIII